MADQTARTEMLSFMKMGEKRIIAHLSVLKLFLLKASRKAFVNRKARNAALPLAVLDMSVIIIAWMNI